MSFCHCGPIRLLAHLSSLIIRRRQTPPHLAAATRGPLARVWNIVVDLQLERGARAALDYHLMCSAASEMLAVSHMPPAASAGGGSLHEGAEGPHRLGEEHAEDHRCHEAGGGREGAARAGRRHQWPPLRRESCEGETHSWNCSSMPAALLLALPAVQSVLAPQAMQSVTCEHCLILHTLPPAVVRGGATCAQLCCRCCSA